MILHPTKPVPQTPEDLMDGTYLKAFPAGPLFVAKPSVFVLGKDVFPEG